MCREEESTSRECEQMRSVRRKTTVLQGIGQHFWITPRIKSVTCSHTHTLMYIDKPAVKQKETETERETEKGRSR